jgi:hypothetical protein
MSVKVKQESLQPVFDPDILDGIWVIHGEDVSGAPLVFIPYMLWANRGKSSMTVFVD